MDAKVPQISTEHECFGCGTTIKCKKQTKYGCDCQTAFLFCGCEDGKAQNIYAFFCSDMCVEESLKEIEYHETC